MFVQEIQGIWKPVWLPCRRSLGKLSSLFNLGNATWILLAVTLGSLRGAHQGWFSLGKFPLWLIFLRDIVQCVFLPRVPVSAVGLMQEVLRLVLCIPRPHHLQLWPLHPGDTPEVCSKAQGIWKPNYTQKTMKTLQSLGVKWQQAGLENESS